MTRRRSTGALRALGRAGCIAMLVVVSSPHVARAASGSMEGRFRSLINAERSSRDLRLLRVATDLVSLAERHSRAMAAKGRIWHTPDLPSKVRNWQVLGENVGVGPTVDRLHEAFMRSDAHRENVLYRAYDHVGIGAAVRDRMIYVTVIFIQRDAPRAARTHVVPRRAGTSRATRERATPARVVSALTTIAASSSQRSRTLGPTTRLRATSQDEPSSIPSAVMMGMAFVFCVAAWARSLWQRRRHRRGGVDRRLNRWVRWAERNRLPVMLSLNSPRSLCQRVVPLPAGLSAPQLLVATTRIRANLLEAGAGEQSGSERIVRLPQDHARRDQQTGQARDDVDELMVIDDAATPAIILPAEEDESRDVVMYFEWADQLFCVVISPGPHARAYYLAGDAWASCDVTAAQLQARGARRVSAVEVASRGVTLPQSSVS